MPGVCSERGGAGFVAAVAWVRGASSISSVVTAAMSGRIRVRMSCLADGRGVGIVPAG
jgi:hypothetical protein